MYQYLYEQLLSVDADISICEHIRCKDKQDSENILSKLNKREVSIQEYTQEEYIKKYMKIGSQSIEYYPWNKLYKRVLLEHGQYPVNCTTEDVVGTYKAILKASKIISSNNNLYLEWAKINRARIDFNLLFQISTSKLYNIIF